MAEIWIVEDDIDIREMESYALESSGFTVRAFSDGPSFRAELGGALPDLVLLDIMLPDEDGLTILKQLRKDSATSSIPVIMVTAKTTEMDKVRGLDQGADDYMTKPFGVLELVSRIKALLRRSGRSEQSLSCAGIVMDDERRRVEENGRQVELTFKEYELLKYLLLHRGTVLSRDKLMDAVWGFAFAGESRTVDMHVKTLRQKLGESGKLIETVRNVGYRLGE